MERLDTVGYRGTIGRFRPEQIEQQSTWQQVPNDQTTTAAMTLIRQIPSDSSTVTTINPLDVGDQWYYEHAEDTEERTVPAGRRL